MKKFLSLVLSLVMTMSLVTIGAGATDYKDLSDKGEIQYEEAVAVLNKLGIITGYEDGSFKPTGSLTRGAAAKIIVSMMIGADAAAALTVAAAPYKDVPVSNTFAAVISYCKTQGYINGYTDGTFRPAAALSGFAFTKMLLGALGYDGVQEGFTGPGWTMKVAALGQSAGLFNDFEPAFVGGTNVDRQNACLLALNTVKATEVEYTGGTNITTTTGNATTNVSTNRERKYKTSNNSKVNKNIKGQDAGNTSDYLTLQFGEDHFTDLKLSKDGDAADDLGRPSNEWTYKNVKIGTYPVAADYTYTTAPDGDTKVDEVKDMNLDDFYFDKNTTLTVNGKDCTDDKDFGLEVGKTTTTKNAKMFDHYATDGVLVEVYLDDDNTDTIEAVVVVKTQMMQVSSVQSDKVTLKRIEDDEQNGKTVENYMNVSTSIKEDDNGYEVLKDLKADDYVLIVPQWDSGSNYKVYSAAVPQTVTGVITSYATKSSNEKVKSITVAGTTYKMSTMWTSEDGDLNSKTILSKSQESTVYLDSYGFAIYVSDVQDSNNAIVIDEIYSSVVDGKIVKYAQGWSTKGDELSINLGTSPSYPYGLSESAMQGKTFEYKTSTSNNADYKLVEHTAAWTKGELVYQAKANDKNVAPEKNETRYVKASAWEATVGGKPVQYASDVKFIFLSQDEKDITGITVTEGVTEVGDKEDTSKQYDLVYVLNDDGDKIVAVVVPNDDDAGNTENLMYIQKTTGYTSTDSKDRVALFTAYIDGEKLTNCQSNKETVDPDTFYTYSKNETTGVYTISKYTKNTDKNTSVKSGDNLDSDDLVKLNDYTFKSESAVDGVPTAVLNAKTATVIDLDTDDDYTFTTVKEMKDAINNKTIDADTGKAITGFKVSYIFNGSDNTGSGKVAYLFIVDTLSNGTTSPDGNTTGGSTSTMDYTTYVNDGTVYFNVTNYKAPNFVPKDAIVSFSYDIYVNDIYAGPGSSAANFADDITSIKVGSDTTAQVKTAGVGATYKDTIELKNIKETYSMVTVKYVNGDTGATLATKSSPVPTATLSTATAATLSFAVDTISTDTKLTYTVTGLSAGNVTTKTALPAADNASQTIPTTAQTAAGNGYVTVTVYGLNQISETYSIDATALASGVTVAGAANDKVTLSFSKTSGIVGTDKVVVTAKLANSITDNYSYDVTAVVNGVTLTAKNVKDTTGVVMADASGNAYVTGISKNVVIAATDVTGTATAKLKVDSATWSVNTLTVVFDGAVDKTTAETVTNYAWDANSMTNNVSTNPTTATLQADGKTVVLAFAGDAFVKDNKITVSNVKDQAKVAVIDGSNDVVTLDTAGACTISAT